MQNHNVSGTITDSSSKTSFNHYNSYNNSSTNDNDDSDNNRSSDIGTTVVDGSAAERRADTGEPAARWERSESAAVGHDGLDGQAGIASPGTARPGQSHFDLGAQLPTHTDDSAAPAYDRLEVNPLGLHLRSDPANVTRGRGVYTDRRIPAGTLIEEAPVLLITKGQWEEGKMDDCILGEYGFCWTGGGQGIGLGLGMFCLSSRL